MDKFDEKILNALESLENQGLIYSEPVDEDIKKEYTQEEIDAIQKDLENKFGFIVASDDGVIKFCHDFLADPRINSIQFRRDSNHTLSRYISIIESHGLYVQSYDNILCITKEPLAYGVANMSVSTNDEPINHTSFSDMLIDPASVPDECSDDYFCYRNDEIDNSVFELIKRLSGKDDLPWNMEIIGAAEDALFNALKDKGIHICHPYYVTSEDSDTDLPCFLSRREEFEDYAPSCDCDYCPFDANITKKEDDND